VRDSGQSADVRVLENTTFGLSFMTGAAGSDDDGQ
jgi:hypothetical protein